MGGSNFCKAAGVIPRLDPLLYERLNKEVKILSFRGYDHFSPAYNIIKRF
ncbi:MULTISPECIES: hypothetical protein [unclassified Rickettsia]